MSEFTLDLRPYRHVRFDRVGEVVFYKRFLVHVMGCEGNRPYYCMYDGEGEGVYILNTDAMREENRLFKDHPAPEFWRLMLDNSANERPKYFDERSTRIFAGFIAWLGTHDGIKLLNDAEKLEEPLSNLFKAVGNLNGDGLTRINPYTIVWAQMNARCRTTQFGRVPMDGLLEEEYNEKSFSAWDARGKDFEVVSLALEWLNTKEGRSFTQGCRRNMQIKSDRESEATYGTKAKAELREWLVNRPHP